MHVNTLFLQTVLAEQEWAERLTEDARRALSPLFWTHVNPYGHFSLDMDSRLDLTRGAVIELTGRLMTAAVEEGAP